MLFIFDRICAVSRKKRPIYKDQCWRNKKKACRNTKRVKNGPSGPTYKKKDWSTRAATSCEEAQNLIASPTSLIIVDVSTLTFIGLGITLRLCQSSMFVCCTALPVLCLSVARCLELAVLCVYISMQSPSGKG